jgi:ribosomal protein S12 methylthiotransferase accessory factor
MTVATEPGAVLERELGAVLGRDVDIDVGFLGWRDELTAPARPVSGRACLSVRLYGSLALLGPLQRDGRGRPCGQCLRRRWQVVQNKDLRDALELGGTTSEAGATPYLTRFARQAIAGQARLLAADAGEPAWPSGCARIVVLDLSTLRTGSVPLAADPECPSCAEVTADCRERALITLEPGLKPTPETFRLRDLDDLELDEKLFVNAACGVVGPDIVRDRTSTTTASASGRMDLRTETYLHQTSWGGHAFSYRDSSRIGILEALERYAGMRSRAKVTATRAAYADLAAGGTRALHPADSGLYPDDAYDRLIYPVERFREDRPISWVWGYSLRDREPLLVPEVLAYYHAAPLAERFVQDCSNGCASGSSLVEAVYFGLMELIERDAFLLVWYGGLPVPEIDAATSESPSARFLIDRLELNGYRARFFDARITFPVPVVVGVAERMDGGIGAMCFGAGASLTPEGALRAALVEIATDAAHLPWRTRFHRSRLLPMVDDFSRVEALHDHPMLYGLPEMAGHASFLLRPGERRPMADLYPGAANLLKPSESLRGDVESCVAMLAEAGHDVIVVNQTLDLQRELGLHTVSVIVPGLLPIDFGWARQRAPYMPRMRTAPRAAGLVDRDLTLADLHLVPHPFP